MDLEKTLDDNYENSNFQIKFAFLHLVQRGDLDAVKDIVERFPNVELDLDTALLNSSHKGHAHVVEFLLDKGADVNTNNGNPLIGSAKEGHLEVVKLLIEKGVNLNVHQQGEMAFFQTCSNGHIEVAKLLIENGINPRVNISHNPEYADDVKNEDIALREAMRNGHLEMGKYLQEQGLDLNIHADFLLRNAMTSNQEDIAHYILDTAKPSEKGLATALEVAATIGNEDMTILLASRGANQEGALKHGTEEVIYALNKYNTKVKLDKETSEKPISMAKQLSLDIQSQQYDYGAKTTKSAKTKI
ncbi:ankyrin repeat domain-containing protein [Ralstonia mannitolilytica]|uniref:ankyrin repeat domain-containing protein n=1 Tax=Ralstonia mannitolilytica TaxID=105219 RepID=UPI001C9588BA|nr:ankyrin repeat domain-containing protein [Ralstonia mannitolilytica]MBY4717594.1 ankyrin repeat domain-containing protein [Ralstonia mannitolilytica]